MRSRRTARVFVFDPAGRVLLIRLVVVRAEGEFGFWLTPGGEIEAGESEVEAAARELREEVGLDVPVAGPMYSEWNRFEHEGEMREIRWWTAEEIEAGVAAGGDRFFPVDLAARVREHSGKE